MGRLEKEENLGKGYLSTLKENKNNKMNKK